MLNNMVYDRTENDVAQKTAKGLYRYTDMNRVRSAVLSICGRLAADGYTVTTPTLKTWSANEIPRVTDTTKYLNAVRMLRNYITMPEQYEIPVTMNGLTYTGANAIEKFLYQLDECIDNIEATWWYCGELYANEVDM